MHDVIRRKMDIINQELYLCFRLLQWKCASSGESVFDYVQGREER